VKLHEIVALSAAMISAMGSLIVVFQIMIVATSVRLFGMDVLNLS
jgi:hypothetical protein